MPTMVAPEGDLWLGKVPWDSTYRHVYYEGMMNKALIVSSFCDLHTTNYSYIPKNGIIRVPYNADELIGYNYCVYQNNNQLFCAFVTEITYVANGTTALTVQEDVWHTWGGLMVVNRCMVARQHVLSDTFGEWRAPEPAMSLEGNILSEQRFTDLSFDTVVVGTNAIPHLKNGSSIFAAHNEGDFDGSDSVAGGYYNHIYSGLKYYAFDRNSETALTNFLDNINKAGAAESIACMFMVPSSLITYNASTHVVTSYGDTYPDRSFAMYTVSARGYSPRNKKCLTFPYCYFVITDYNGGVLTVKYEDCEDGEVKMRFEQGLDATATLFVTLLDHQGVSVDYAHSMVLSQNPQCSWVYQAYQNWMAQNASTQQTKSNINMFNALVGVGMVAIGGALMATGAGAPAGGVVGKLGLGLTTGEVMGAGLMATGAGRAISSGMETDMQRANISDQSKIPNHISGQSSSNALQGVARNMGGYMRIGLQRQSAERLDQFFDVFGYAIDMVTMPNLTGRPSWNYVKTVGASMGGAIPRDRMATINGCLDRGITFWHTVDVGNYGLSNTLS